jgi:hypothetical protein
MRGEIAHARRLASIAFSACVILSGAVHAGNPGELQREAAQLRYVPGMIGYTLYRQTWDPLNPASSDLQVLSEQPDGLTQNINQAWNLFVSRAKGAMESGFDGMQVQSGMNLYGVNVTIGPMDAAHLLVSAGDTAPYPGAPTASATQPVLALHSTQARIDTSMTTPVTARDSDPKFHVTFDLNIYVQLKAGPGASAIGLNKAIVVPGSPQISPDNLPAQAGQLISAVAQFLGQGSFQDQLQQLLSGQQTDISGILAPALVLANSALTAKMPAGYAIRGIFADSTGLSLIAAPPPVAINSAGEIAGQLHVKIEGTMPEPLASNASCNGLFKVNAQVQRGAPAVSSLHPLNFSYDPSLTQTLTPSLIGGAIQPEAGGWTCSFVIDGLSTGVADSITFPSGLKPNGSLPTAGTVLTVALQTCPDPVPIPSGAARCDLSGTQTFTASTGVGLRPQSAVRGFNNPSDPAQTTTAGMSAWSTKAPAQTSTQAPSWGTPGSTVQRTPGSVITARPAGTQALPQAVPQQPAPSAFGSP